MAKTCQLNAFYIYLIYKAWIVIPDMLNKFSSKVSNAQTMLESCMGCIWVDPMATSNLFYKDQYENKNLSWYSNGLYIFLNTSVFLVIVRKIGYII